MPKLRLLANPWGLAEWFKEMTPLEADFAKMFEGRAMAHDRAPGEPVPDQEPAYRKSRALIALQLIKRWRNVLFAKRERAKLRRPPSVLAVQARRRPREPHRDAVARRLSIRRGSSCSVWRPKRPPGG